MSKTEQNLQDAFAGESQANRKYLAFAQKADSEGYGQVARLFRAAAAGDRPARARRRRPALHADGRIAVDPPAPAQRAPAAGAPHALRRGHVRHRGRPLPRRRPADRPQHQAQGPHPPSGAPRESGFPRG